MPFRAGPFPNRKPSNGGGHVFSSRHVVHSPDRIFCITQDFIWKIASLRRVKTAHSFFLTSDRSAGHHRRLAIVELGKADLAAGAAQGLLIEPADALELPT